MTPSQFVSIHRLASSPGRGLIAVRPDGYVGYRCQATDIRQLAAWLVRLGLPQRDLRHRIQALRP